MWKKIYVQVDGDVTQKATSNYNKYTTIQMSGEGAEILMLRMRQLQIARL
jgi:hypothetical protein